MSRRVSKREWLQANTQTAVQTAALYGVDSPEPPGPGLEHVGWTWEYADGSAGLVRLTDTVRNRSQPVRMRPVWASR